MRSVKIQVSLSPCENSHRLKLPQNLQVTAVYIYFFYDFFFLFFFFNWSKRTQSETENKGKHKPDQPQIHKAEILKTHLSTKFWAVKHIHVCLLAQLLLFNVDPTGSFGSERRRRRRVGGEEEEIKNKKAKMRQALHKFAWMSSCRSTL